MAADRTKLFGRVFNYETEKIIEMGGTAVHYTLFGGLRAAAYGGDRTSVSLAEVINALPIGRTAAWNAYEDFLRCGVVAGPDGKKYGARGEKVIQPVTEWHDQLTATRWVKGNQPTATRTVTVRQTVGQIRQADGDRPPSVLKRADIEREQRDEDGPVLPSDLEALEEELSLLESAPREMGWRFERAKDLAELRKLRALYPTRDLRQAVEDFVERGEPIRYWQMKYVPLEAFIKQADDVAPREPEFHCPKCETTWGNATRCPRETCGGDGNRR